MLRIVCREVDLTKPSNGMGPFEEIYKTFDVDLPLIEEWVRKPKGKCEVFYRSIIGVEVFDAEEPGV